MSSHLITEWDVGDVVGKDAGSS
ncbi:hypothetical protein SBRY_50558 [Actinacidiphila bryophytorum]|uniref:Uncharacterized protein n=1 Tax=Actinacidiphila bryophytorum TaxID=1436133 RepID=A0A9W4MDK5_9ACTN|nr:hypothetical protein SBRY_50558 [Actinacidiphila bryophytorum]